MKVDIKIAKYSARYGCYNKLPTQLRNKKAILNIKSKDERCFLYAIIACFYPVKNLRYEQRCNVSNYLAHENDFNLKDITFPVTLEMVSKFAKNNLYVYKYLYF